MVNIKALSVYQPWAQLIAQGEKRVETRSWSTDYRGKLAIQAGMRIIPLKYWPIEETKKHNIYKIKRIDEVDETIVIKDMPCGAVLAVCDLVNCIRITPELAAFLKKEDSKEFIFGDYRLGRYAWILDNIEPFLEPVPLRGRPRLWDWHFLKKGVFSECKKQQICK